MRQIGSTKQRRTGGRWMVRPLVLAAVVALASGCFSYQEVTTPEPPQNQRLRMELTGAGQDNLERRHGLRMEHIEGRLLAHQGDEFSLEVRLDANRLGGFGNGVFLDTLSIPGPEVREVQVREFSTSRTVVTSLVGVGLVFGAWGLMEANRSGEGDNGESGSGGENFSLIPVLGALAGLFR